LRIIVCWAETPPLFDRLSVLQTDSASHKFTCLCDGTKTSRNCCVIAISSCVGEGIQVHRVDAGPFVISDATGVPLPCRDDLEGVRFAHNHLTSDEAHRIINSIALSARVRDAAERLSPTGRRWISVEGIAAVSRRGWWQHVRAHWGFIDAVCKMNSIPFDGTAERIQRDGMWCVYEFAVQLDAIQFWDRFDGRWLRGDEFIIRIDRKACRS
jgi:hypothetical protein